MGKVGLGNSVSRFALAAYGATPPNYGEVIQWLGGEYQGTDDLWYQKDKKGDQLRTVHLGGYLDMNGVDNALSFPDLTGITIDSWEGTTTLTKNVNIIEATAGNLEYLTLSDGSVFDFEGLNPDIDPTVYDKSGNDNHGTIVGTGLDTIYQESIEVRSYRNEFGYNEGVSGEAVPRLETAENIALPVKQQTDIFGNVLTNYGRARLDDQLVESSVFLTSTADFRRVETDYIPTSATTSVRVKGKFVTITPAARHWFGCQDTAGNNDKLYFGISSTGFWTLGWGSFSVTSAVTVLADTVYDIVAEPGKLTVNGVLVIDGSVTAISSVNMPVFTIGAWLSSAGKNFTCDFETFLVEISEGSLVRKYKCGAGNGGDLYDSITGQTISYEGTGDPWTTSDEQRPNNLIDGFSPALVSDGVNDYINSLTPASVNTRIETSFEMANDSQTKLFGTRTSSNLSFFGVSSGDFYSARGEDIVTLAPYSSGKHDLVYDVKNNKVILDEVETLFDGAAFTTTNDYYIFAEFITSAINFSNSTIYYFRIYDDDVLVRDFIPVVKGTMLGGSFAPSDCLYDRVSETYFTNQGTGDFGLVRIPAKEGSTTLDALGNELLNPYRGSPHNGAETERLKPDSPELYAVDNLHDTQLWYSGTTAISYKYEDVVADRENKHLVFADVFSKTPTKFNDVVYGTAQIEPTLTEVQKFVKSAVPYETTDGNYPVEEGLYYVLKEGAK